MNKEILKLLELYQKDNPLIKPIEMKPPIYRAWERYVILSDGYLYVTEDEDIEYANIEDITYIVLYIGNTLDYLHKQYNYLEKITDNKDKVLQTNYKYYIDCFIELLRQAKN